MNDKICPINNKVEILTQVVPISTFPDWVIGVYAELEEPLSKEELKRRKKNSQSK